MRGSPPILAVAGSQALLAFAETKAVASNLPFDQITLSREECDRIIAEALPPQVRAAWEHGKEHAKQTQPARFAEEARLQAHEWRDQQTEQGPAVAVAQLEDTRMNGSTLSAADVTTAQNLITRMSQPLSAEERNVCAKMGIQEAAFLAERNRELERELPGWHEGTPHGLTQEEASVARTMGVSYEAYAAGKKQAG